MLLRILILLLVLIIVPPIYLDRTYIRRRYQRKWRFLFYLPNLIMLGAAISLTAFETYSPRNAFITNWFLTIFLGYIVTESILAFFLATGHRLRKHLGLRNTFYALGFMAAIGNVYVILTGVSYGKYHTVVKHTFITSPVLPASYDGYRIVQLSDFHLGTYRNNPDFVRNVVQLVQAQKPDLIVFTGDLVNYNADELDPFISELSRFKAPDGVFSIMGNHDYMTYIKWKTEADQYRNICKLRQNERKMGWTLLLNDHRILSRGTDSIAIAGIENDGNPPFPQHGDLAKALNGIPAKMDGKPFYKILLSHDPCHWQSSITEHTDVQLTLSGHTHGGQLEILGFAPLSLITKHWGGLYQQGGQKLYVSTGIGEAFLTFRYGIWPQIDVITLQKKNS